MSAENSLIVRIEKPVRGQLGEAMNAIRSWLDSQKIEPATFKAVSAGFELAFRQEDDARRFRQHLEDAQLA